VEEPPAKKKAQAPVEEKAAPKAEAPKELTDDEKRAVKRAEIQRRVDEAKLKQAAEDVAAAAPAAAPEAAPVKAEGAPEAEASKKKKNKKKK